MSSWVYLFSRFTHEALLLESLVILAVISAYSAYWVLKKRRDGAVDESVPSIPVRNYLDEIIRQAEQLRYQLFGILYQPKPYSLEPQLNDSELLVKVRQLEMKLSDKERGLESLGIENNRLSETLGRVEKQLNELKNKMLTGPNEVKEQMEEQIRTLEEKLAEYSIIEDDLANLKRFQNENIKLKAALTERGIPLPAAASPDGKAAAAPAPALEIEPQTLETKSSPQAEPAPEPAAGATTTSNPREATDNSIESLLGASGATSPVPSLSPSDEKAKSKEEDLVEEFEKMLKE